MTNRNEDIKQALEEYTKKNTVSPEAARRALVAEGIFNEDGTLHENYGGKSELVEKLERNMEEFKEQIETFKELASVQPMPSEPLMDFYRFLEENKGKAFVLVGGEGSYDPKSGGC